VRARVLELLGWASLVAGGALASGCDKEADVVPEVCAPLPAETAQASTSEAAACAPMDAKVKAGPEGQSCACSLGFAWNGEGCTHLGGCACEGHDCSHLTSSAEECEKAHASCGGDHSTP
jgi:hypothetical protein